MNKLLLFCFLVLNTQVLAQNADVYVDLPSLNDNHSFPIDSVSITRRAKRDILLVGGNDIKITSANDSLNDVLKKECFAVKCRDTLFLNCRSLMKTTWYAPALYRSEKFIYFMACEGFGKLSAQNAGYASGVIGGAFAGAARAQKKYSYLIFLDSGKVIALGKKAMKGLLAENAALLNRYLEEDTPGDPETIISYLRKIH